MLGEQNNLWSVNTDMEYHERVLMEAGLQDHEALEMIQGAIIRIFLKLDRVAFGLSLGSVVGVLLFLATLWIVLKGGDTVGPKLRLLNQYFPGYSVTASGSVLGLGYGFISGFIGGWIFAFLRNASLFLYTILVYRRAERGLLRKIFDYL